MTSYLNFLYFITTSFIALRNVGKVVCVCLFVFGFEAPDFYAVYFVRKLWVLF